MKRTAALGLIALAALTACGGAATPAPMVAVTVTAPGPTVTATVMVQPLRVDSLDELKAELADVGLTCPTWEERLDEYGAKCADPRVIAHFYPEVEGNDIDLTVTMGSLLTHDPGVAVYRMPFNWVVSVPEGFADKVEAWGGFRVE
ncbi:MAG: hypothetical protein IPJ61_13035 [Tessaracoccus sp.]|uniref:hypothetical protein n=1 Tax=Tessaracoccus sp. TaxID=1971211 RepID=UPI001EC6A218|nr:hypothetical protein [Tessaracoccus sp.]MBK7821962.1 hypothetical protein [Tessaracoccus sp.]